MYAPTIMFVDNTNPDDSVAVLAACNPLLRLNVVAVVVTGRFAHDNPNAPITTCSQSFSNEILLLNTKRMQGLLNRHGYNVPVFSGLIAPQTIVPHNVHISERRMDFYNDWQNTQIAGDFEAFCARFSTIGPKIDVISTSPMTSLAAFAQRVPAHRLGVLTAQIGAFGSVSNMGGERRQFNAACDPAAAKAVLCGNYTSYIYIVPTDVTKSRSLGYKNPRQLAKKTSLPSEVIRMYEVFYELALRPRGEMIFTHDLHASLLMSGIGNGGFAHLGQDFPYTSRETHIADVSANGEVITSSPYLHLPEQFVVSDIASRPFAKIVQALNAGTK